MLRLRFQWMDDGEKPAQMQNIVPKSHTSIVHRTFSLSDTWRKVRDVLRDDVYFADVSLGSTKGGKVFLYISKRSHVR